MSENNVELEHKSKRRGIHSHDFTIEISWNIWQENYGADADGNRGEMRTEYEPEEIVVCLLFSAGKTIRSRVIDHYKISDTAIQAGIEKIIDNAEPSDSDYMAEGSDE